MDKERSGETMKLGAFFHPTGNHVAAWLHPDAQIDAGTNFRHYAEITQTAERGKFDLMFVADAVATRDGKLEALSRWPQYMAYFDPLTLLPALAAVTTHVGLCATATTSYNEPYHIARKFASLVRIHLPPAESRCKPGFLSVFGHRLTNIIWKMRSSPLSKTRSTKPSAKRSGAKWCGPPVRSSGSNRRPSVGCSRSPPYFCSPRSGLSISTRFFRRRYSPTSQKQASPCWSKRYVMNQWPM
jgi:hypothetical protein